jgi:uncharacterized membrane protein YidH (DUF202 family)
VTTPFDPGLQPERTQLAWRRTALSITIGSLVALRALPLILGDPIWMIPGIVGVAAAGLLWIASARRARAVDAALSSVPHPERMPDGRLIAVLAGGTVAVGLSALAAVTLIALAG